MNLYYWRFPVIVLGITLFEGAAQGCLRKACDVRDTLMCKMFIVFGMAAYAAVALLLFHAYQSEALGHVNLVWSCTSIIMAYVIGHFLFREVVNMYSVIAVFFACIAIVFAQLSEPNVS